MKANEAPEKIYIPTILAANTVRYKEEGTIEYTRTDAFIEKAVSYLNSKLCDWISITNPDQRSYAHVILKKDFIEDFKNYIKENKV